MLRFFTADLWRNIIKIICLTIGLAVGFLLVAKIYFEQTYDSFFPDADRIYRVSESVEINGEYKEHHFTPGAIAPGIARYAPQVESATRMTGITPDGAIKLADGRMLDTEGIAITDSCYFDVLSTKIISGNPHDVLGSANICMIPRSLADKIGGDVIGLTFCMPSFSEDYTVSIGGVYEDYPLNSTIRNRLYLGMPTMRHFNYDGSENWVGNDRYTSLVKLLPGADPDDLRPHIDKMRLDNLDEEALKMANLDFHLIPLVGLYSSLPVVHTMVLLLTLLAVVMLMCAGLNYLLIVIGQLTKRGREMAVRKCYGTSNARIFGRVMGESLFFLIFSFGLAVLVAFSLSDLCNRLLGYTPAQFLSTKGIWMAEGAVCLVLLVITGVIPAWIYCRTSVAGAFRSDTRGRRGWKLALLSVQFVATGMLMCLLVLVGRQYRLLSATDLGFEYENIGYVNISGLPSDQRSSIVTELRRLGCVEGVASAYHEFSSLASGNNIWEAGGDPAKQFNVADLYAANPEIFEVLGIDILRGELFRTPSSDSLPSKVIVEQRFADQIKKHFGIDDVIGFRFTMTEHCDLEDAPDLEVVGVMGNMRRGGFQTEDADKRGAVMFPGSWTFDNLYVRFSSLTPASLSEAQKVINGITDRELYIIPCLLYTSPSPRD